MNKKLIRNDVYDSMMEMLTRYQDAGVKITYAGSPSSPREIAYACATRETNEYMLDYIPDKCGRINEVRFDSLRSSRGKKSTKKKHFYIV